MFEAADKGFLDNVLGGFAITDKTVGKRIKGCTVAVDKAD